MCFFQKWGGMKGVKKGRVAEARVSMKIAPGGEMDCVWVWEGRKEHVSSRTEGKMLGVQPGTTN